MPLSMGNNTELKKKAEEQRNLANCTDSQTDMTNAAEESPFGSIDVNSTWQSVYRPTTVSLKYEVRSGMGKYVESLKHLLPVRVNIGPGSFMPVDMAGCCAFTFFSWLTPLVCRTFRKGLVQSDLYHCSPFDSCQVNGARLSNIWEKQMQKTGHQNIELSKLLFQFIRTRFIMTCLVYLFCVTCGFLGPTLFMRLLLQYTEKTEIDHVEGVKWMFCIIVCEFLRVICFSLMWAINIRTAVRAGSAVMALLYRKITKLRTVSSTSVGEIINLFSNDCQKVFLMVYNAPLIIGGPLVITGSMIYTWLLFGPFCFVGVGVFLLCYVSQFGISYLIALCRKLAISATDERVSLMAELLANIKLIKLCAWEKPFVESLQDARANEKLFLEKCQYLQILSSSVTSMAAVVSTISTILAYTLCGHDLTASEAFTLVLVNSIASHGIRTLPVCYRDIVNGSIALSRIKIILQLDEKQSCSTIPNNPEHAVNVMKATLDWEQVIPNLCKYSQSSKKGEINLTVSDAGKNAHPDEVPPDTALVTLQSETGLPPTLIDISFILPKGKLFGVCGTVGSGKSSLLSALLGQMRLLSGQIALQGSVAYVSQQPWLLNSTLRENILFGQLFSSKRYYEAVYCCGLTDDLAALPAGDQTEIGEKGANLSGGQKQRICLGRAQYADRDLYFLDDPLSSVDSQVGKHIFQHCIKGALKGKSILLITQQLKYLQECDSIILLRDGHIVEQGSHEELMSRESEYSALVQVFSKDNNVTEEIIYERSSQSPSPNLHLSPVLQKRNLSKSPSMTSCSDLDESDICDGHLTTNEKITTGDISWDTYIAYMQAAGGFIVCGLIITWFILQSASETFGKYWLGYWLSEGDGNSTSYGDTSNSSVQSMETKPSSIIDNPHIEFYQLVYGLSITVMFTISVILGFLFTKTSLRASSSLHDRMLFKLFHSPMYFFETTPVGRILNIFTHDIDEIDTHLPMLIVSFLDKLIAVIFALLIVAVIFHWFFITLIMIAVCFIYLQRLFRGIMRDLKRYENASRSPIFSHVGATVQGLPIIKAFQKQDEFFDRFTQYVDQRSSPQYLFYCSMRWLGLRMDFLCLFITVVTALFVVFLKGEVEPAFAALALTLAFQLSGMYQYVVRIGCDVETRFTSVERIQSFSEDLEVEAPAIIEKNRPSPDWPTRGRIYFLDVKMRYRSGLPLALKGLTFDISPQEKIGIVGRTGSGKSSIGTVLFRLVELTSGNIFIDGINIKDLGLEDLRSRMSIIPQDPILFQGTIRYNLDPLNIHDDKELWNALERTHMKEKVKNFEKNLDAIVMEGGENFSVGEKQLLCMARALLRHNKVILLDEATASIDSETDNILQKTIQQVFADSTVLTIAHRLTTVVNCDRIIVLSEGKIVEFDKPSVLLENPKSYFSTLMATHGILK